MGIFKSQRERAYADDVKRGRKIAQAQEVRRKQREEDKRRVKAEERRKAEIEKRRKSTELYRARAIESETRTRARRARKADSPMASFFGGVSKSAKKTKRAVKRRKVSFR